MLIILMLMPAANALAAKRALFILGTLHQDVNLLYSYTGQSASQDNGDSQSSSQNRFLETYNIGLSYAVLDPNLLKGNVSAGGKLEQNMFSSTRGSSTNSSGAGYRYNITGTLLERAPIGLTFFTHSEETFVQRTFTPGYNITSDGYGMGTWIRNRIIPVRINFSRSASETNGLADDRRQTNDQVTIEAVNDYKDISHTDLNIVHYLNRSEPKSGTGVFDEDRSYAASARNRLSSSGNLLNLNSSMQLREQEHLGRNDSFNWQEMFTWRLGRALNLDLSYNNNRYSYQNTVNNTSTTSAVQSSGLSISHRLFQSLTSRFDLHARQSEFDTGKENSYSGAVYFDYLKTLPAQSNLQLSYSESLDVTDRNVSSQTALAIDEPLTAQLTGQNLLFHPNVDTGSIIVRNADPNVRVAPYVTGVDYEALPNGDFTGFNFAIIGSEILDGANLLITYKYLANPSIKYQTSSRRVSGSLSLSGRRLKIYGSIDQSNQDLLSGSAEFVQLNKSTTTIAGVGSELNSIFSGIEYTNYDSTLNKYQSYNSFVRLNRYLYGGSFKLQLRHRYANYDVSPSSPTERTENVFDAGGNYSRLLFNRIQGDFDARYTNSIGQSASRSDITLNLRLRWSYGKILLQLEERAAWRFVSGSSFRDDQITFQLTRYF